METIVHFKNGWDILVANPSSESYNDAYCQEVERELKRAALIITVVLIVLLGLPILAKIKKNREAQDVAAALSAWEQAHPRQISPDETERATAVLGICKPLQWVPDETGLPKQQIERAEGGCMRIISESIRQGTDANAVTWKIVIVGEGLFLEELEAWNIQNSMRSIQLQKNASPVSILYYATLVDFNPIDSTETKLTAKITRSNLEKIINGQVSMLFSMEEFDAYKVTYSGMCEISEHKQTEIVQDCIRVFGAAGLSVLFYDENGLLAYVWPPELRLD